MTVKIRVRDFQSIEDAEIEVSGLTVITGQNNTGKALKNGTLVATPKGWVPVEALSAGDLVVAGDGSPTRVLGVFPQGVRPTYTVKFDDGRAVTVDGGHLWTVSIGKNRFPKGSQTWTTMTTEAIRQSVGPYPRGVQRPSIPVAGAVQYEPQTVPVDPYLLGVLLGDGHLTGNSVGFSTIDDEILRSVESVLPDGLRIKRNGNVGYRIARPKGDVRGGTLQGNPVLNGCRELDVLVGSEQKFIPDRYKYNTVDVRLAVLQGLMDTDGSVDRIGGVYFYTISDKLADDVTEVVHSLGGKVRRRLKTSPTFTHKGERRAGKPCHILCVRLLGADVFRLSRKLSRVRPPVRRNDPLIVSIVPAGDYPCTCIAVEHSSHLFQVEGHLVTHNSAMLRAVHGVFTNARGTKYVRHGRDQCSVTLTFGDGRTVTWEKGEKVNRYTVDGKVLDKVGSGVPVEVESFGVVPITASGREIWPQFAPQFTGQVFLLDQPGSVLAESVADVSRVGVLNEALRNTQSDKRALSSELKVRLGDVARYEAQEASYAGLDTVEALAQEAEALHGQVADLQRQLEGVITLRDSLTVLSQTLLDLRPVEGVEVPGGVDEARSTLTLLDDALDLQAKLGGVTRSLEVLAPVAGVTIPDETDTTRARKVSDALSLVADLRDRMRPFMDVVGDGGALREVVTDDLPDVDGVSKGLLGLADLRAMRDTLTARMSAITGYRADLQRTTEGYEVAVHEVQEIIGDAGSCPICGHG